MNNRLPTDINSLFLFRATCFFWLVAKAISYKVWLTTGRLFPVVPVFDFLGDIPAIIHSVLFAVSVTVLAAAILKPQARFLYYSLLICELLSVMLDYSRWQPWEYQYLFVLFIFISTRKEQDSTRKILLILVALYFYSGLQKLNAGFINQVWDKMLLMSFLKIPHAVRAHSWLMYAGYCIGIAEVLSGLGLLFSKTRKTSIAALIVMHLFNLIWLGPLGLDYNEIVWPWNILMIIYLYQIGYAKTYSHIKIQPVIKGNLFLIICWWVLPALNFFGAWDNYLSCSLYSGKLPLMAICLPSTPATIEFAPYIKATDKFNFCNGNNLVKLQSWAMEELKVPPYPEVRVYRKIEKIISQKYKGSKCYLYYYSKSEKFDL